tara:strand:+ start:1804 stop:2178 length:375 start_codon:yes stop_codon:yes gene_type:complete
MRPEVKKYIDSMSKPSVTEVTPENFGCGLQHPQIGQIDSGLEVLEHIDTFADAPGKVKIMASYLLMRDIDFGFELTKLFAEVIRCGGVYEADEDDNISKILSFVSSSLFEAVVDIKQSHDQSLN